MKILINSKENKKLLENFPEDPYSDITIITQYSRLKLVLAFLSIDSEYFASLDPSTKEVNLSHLNEEPLIKVLKSLYGAELVAFSVTELFSLYEVIQQLQIDEYKSLLKESLLEILTTQRDSPLLNSIELLEFCINNNILVQEMKNFHFDTKLKILESSKNYLQLNKLSQTTLSSLLLDFHELNLQKGDQIINHILQNYFNRKNIRPAVYFANQALQELKIIWEKFHHKISVVSEFTASTQGKGSVQLSNTVGNLGRLNSMTSLDLPMRKSQTNLNKILKAPLQTASSTIFKSQSGTQNSTLDSKISALEQQLKAKDDLIKKLRHQLKTLKQAKPLMEIDSDKEDTEASLLLNLVKSKKSKQVSITNLDNIREVESFQASRDLNNAARVFGKNGANKRIFQEGSK